MKGGHARSGPPPDPNALRRDRKDDAAWTVLPAEGRKGDLPDWPLSRPTAREMHWWRHLWGKPQAVMWDRQGQQLEVAVYVRRLTLAEDRKASVSLVTQVRQLADALGLTIPGMRMHRWRIAEDEVAQQREQRQPEPAVEGRQSARDRFRVVDAAG